MKLLLQGIIKFILGIVIVGVMLFIPANTISYYHAWLFIGVLFIPMLIFGIVLFIKEPKLLEKRLNSKEKENTQKAVIFLSFVLFVGGFILAGFNFRYKWLMVPNWLVITSSVLLLIAYGLYIEVMRENVYLSRTVEIQDNQKVIDTGLYSLVRHPMYFATTLLFLTIPLVLGSWFSFFIFLLFIPLLIIRIINEEKVLTENLKGYNEYKKKVRYRLFPFIW